MSELPPGYRPPRHGRTALVLSLAVAGMLGLSYASVPLYELFCKVTGYAGTTQRADAADAPADAVSDRTFTVQFDANTAGDLPWTFRPEQRAVTVRAGEQKLVFYKAVNNTSRPVTGRATFNVTPDKSGQYFVKIACFCFEEQTLQPGQSVDMPVTFYVDPAVLKDRNLDEVKTITLSYTFFRAQDDETRSSSAEPRSVTN